MSEADKKLFELGFTKEIENKRRIDFCSKHFISETNIISFDLKRKQLECFVESDSPFLTIIDVIIYRLMNFIKIKNVKGIGIYQDGTTNKIQSCMSYM